MAKYIFGFILGIGLFTSLTFTSCKKPFKFSKENLNFSTDTIVFDTVFTTIGSTTKRLKIYNPSNSTLKIDEIELVGGSASPFRINVDGEKGTYHANLEMEKGDSLFIFVEVTLSVNNGNLPFIVEDRIRFKTNGKDQFVQLAVWGQDAYFHYSDANSGIWPNDKPHVIYGYAAIDSAQTLTIQQDTKIYLHKDAILYNYKGTLNINGTHGHEVVFEGDRLESYYQDQSGQYYGIYFYEARPSKISYAIIKNGTSGIHLFSEDPSNTSYTLQIDNTVIYNNARYGIFIYSGAKVKAENCLIYKNQAYALFVLEGGDFNFNYCNLLGYASTDQIPAVGISNFYKNSDGVLTHKSINEGTITNSIITGNQATELAIVTQNPGGIYNLVFNITNCLIKSEEIPTASYFNPTTIKWNQNPGFADLNEDDYHISSSSPLNGAANAFYFSPIVFRDLDNKVRTNPEDIGVYESN
jgi:hypothetical protein